MGARPLDPDAGAPDDARHVLFLAYHFPPVGGSGVQRNVKFARYLTDHRYRSTILTGSAEARGFWTPFDESLLLELPPSVMVNRVPATEPTGNRPWRDRLDRLVSRPEAVARWWNAQIIEHGPRLGDFDLIYASLTPYETSIAASRLARELNRPWVADLQDPWALDEIWFYPTGLHRRLDLRRMRSVLSTAEAIIVNSNEAELRFRREMPELGDRVSTIPNGFDDHDFRGPPPVRNDGRFRIVHAGYLYTAIGQRHRRTETLRKLLGGTAAGVDVLPRSIVFLLQAVERLIAERPELADLVEIHLAGMLSSADAEVARSSSLVHAHGYLPHAESVALVRSADLLFLPLHDVPAGTRVGIVPGKTYEYLASGRPVLAAVPDGDARDLLLHSGASCLCRPRDVPAMARCISSQIELWRSGEVAGSTRRDVIARFERRQLTADLAAVFDKILMRPGHGTE